MQREVHPILAEVIGYGFSSDGMHISVPDVLMDRSGQISMALKDLRLVLIKLIILMHMQLPHLSAIRLRQWQLTIYSKKPNTKPAVSSTKSMPGHELWMAGQVR